MSDDIEDIVAMARAAYRDDRLADGALYGKLAAEIERLRAHIVGLEKLLSEEGLAAHDDAEDIKRLRARVEVLKQHLRDAVSVADMAMSDANGCDCRAEKKWDREAELRVFRDALKEAQP